ncbi:Sister chromatid cohesion protein pds5 [Tieghemiomyces parasiticus]|uniref:Sister chromatid cohesion protein pds5 n=1 Tax=Tieghemiomyces parasiticus TaxID=78921 RepID=A0A9W7ZU35_9FUNG|nr:Sister chromatid cohesion protein pds5 [Tieghemiomyces parasiticus]
MATLQTLQFKLKLVPDGKKTIPPAELAKRLTTLHTELAELDQEAVDVRSLDTVARHLITPALLAHKEDGVRIRAACCLADVLRLYAPEAPYDDGQLRTLFEAFLQELGHLAQGDGPDFPLYFYLLESLSTVKSVVLVVDLPNPEPLIVEFFRLFFDLTHPDQSRNLQLCMVDILQQLVEEASAVPQEVVDILLAQFLKKRQTANPAAHQLACDLCNAATDILQKYIGQYFTDVIVTASQHAHADGPSPEQLTDFKTAHYLIKELNRACPSLLLNVIPQLAEELTLDNVHLRTLATSVLGDMIAERGHALVRRYPAAWKAWVQRRADKNVQVRVLWVELAVHLYRVQPQLAPDINAAVLSKVADPEEKVRAAVPRALAQLDYDTLAYAPLDPAILHAVGHRCRDKRAPPRQEAFRALAHMFGLAYPALEARDPRAVERFGWIPATFLHTFYANEPDALAAAEHALTEAVFPASTSWTDPQRTRRLLVVLQQLDDRARKAFVGWLQRQRAAGREVGHYLDLCERYNAADDHGADDGEGVLAALNQIIQRLTARLPDSAKHVHQLFTFAKLHDPRLYRLMRETLDPQLEHRAIRKAQREALKRLESLAPTLVDTFTGLLRRVALTVVNESIVVPLVAFASGQEAGPIEGPEATPTRPSTQLATPGDPTGAGPGRWTAAELAPTARSLLSDLATVFPELYKRHAAELLALLNDGPAGATDDAQSLQTLAQFAKVYPADVPSDAAAVRRLRAYAERGSPTEAKYAAAVLAHLPGATGETACSTIMKTVTAFFTPERLTQAAKAGKTDGTLATVLAHLRVAAQIARHRPTAFAPYADTLTQVVLREVVRRPSGEAGDADWVAPADLDLATRCRGAGLKLFAARLLGSPAAAVVSTVAPPVLQLLYQTVARDGELATDQTTPPAARSFLRLTAATTLLLLAGQERYDALLAPNQVERLGTVIQDPCYPVRRAFAGKLIGHLNQFRLPQRYLPCLFLVAYDTEAEMQLIVRSFVKRQMALAAVRDRFAALYETALPRLLHLLAHDPDFQPEVAKLLLVTGYIDFYLDLVARAENVSLIFYLVSQLKTVADRIASTADGSEPLYALSDLAQYLIQERCQAHQWPLPSYPGSVALPRDLFAPVEDDTRLSEIAKRSFLPRDFIREHNAQGARAGRTPAARRPRSTDAGKSATHATSDTDGEADGGAEASERPTTRKRRTPATAHRATPAAKRKRRGATTSSESEDSAGDSDASNDEVGAVKLMRREPEPPATPSRRNAPRRARATRQTAVASDDDSDSD